MASWTWIVCSFTSKDKSGWLWIATQLILSMRNCWLRNSLGNTGWKLHDSLFEFMGICETAWACTFWSTPVWPFPCCAVRPVYLSDTMHLNDIYIYNCKFPTIVSNKIVQNLLQHVSALPPQLLFLVFFECIYSAFGNRLNISIK